jgi:putative spermidine/putrescine transport system permease protein
MSSTAISVGAAVHRAPARRLRRIDGWGLLLVPGVVFLLLAFGVPLAGMMLRSLTDPSPAKYLEVFQTRTFLVSMGYTFQLALIVTLACLLLGYPWAYLMHTAGPKLRWVLAGMVILPFWSSLLVRTYAWSVLLRPSGVINYVLHQLGLVQQPLALMGNTLGVAIGMTQIMLPFMVLPLFAVMSRMDPDLMPAAQGLGARPISAFMRVFLPLTLPGVAAGSVLVFVVSLGFYITPTVLGSARSPMLSQHIVNQTSVLLDFGLASALAVVLLAITVTLIYVGSRFASLGEALGFEERRQ